MVDEKTLNHLLSNFAPGIQLPLDDRVDLGFNLHWHRDDRKLDFKITVEQNGEPISIIYRYAIPNQTELRKLLMLAGISLPSMLAGIASDLTDTQTTP